MRSCKEHNVLAVYDLRDKAGRANFAGFLDAMSDASDWHLYVRQPGAEFTERDVLGLNGRTYDGFVVSMPGTEGAMRELAHSKVPTVLVNITDKRLSARTDDISFVWEDNADIGRQGAQHLLERGTYRSAGFVKEIESRYYSYEREVAFRASMKRAGLASQVLDPCESLADYPRRLREWLRNLPKPAAVMAVSDMRAADVINVCRAEGLAVPEQVAVIGVDNDVFQHEKCGMAISTILHDARLMGWMAAKELEFIFGHPRRKGRPHEILVPVKEVIPRESSARSLLAAKLVEHAIDFIQANRNRNICRADVVAHLGCSLQLAELRFRQIVGTTISATIEKARMDEVVRRLKSEPRSVRQIAKEMHFSSANQLSRIYKRHFGTTITG